MIDHDAYALAHRVDLGPGKLESSGAGEPLAVPAQRINAQHRRGQDAANNALGLAPHKSLGSSPAHCQPRSSHSGCPQPYAQRRQRRVAAPIPQRRAGQRRSAGRTTLADSRIWHSSDPPAATRHVRRRPARARGREGHRQPPGRRPESLQLVPGPHRLTHPTSAGSRARRVSTLSPLGNAMGELLLPPRASACQLSEALTATRSKQPPFRRDHSRRGEATLGRLATADADLRLQKQVCDAARWARLPMLKPRRAFGVGDDFWRDHRTRESWPAVSRTSPAGNMQPDQHGRFSRPTRASRTPMASRRRSKPSIPARSAGVRGVSWARRSGRSSRRSVGRFGSRGCGAVVWWR